MKPSEAWKKFNDNQFWKHLPNDYHSHLPVENDSKNPHKAVTIRLNLSAREMAYLKQWKGSNKHFYPSLESAAEALLTRIVNEPMDEYLPEGFKEPPKEQHMKQLIIVVSSALRERLDSQKVCGKQRTASNKLRFLLTNSTQLSFNEYFKPLIKLKSKNPSRKEVI
ncbi:hypothetical protein P7I26_16300 [Enterococcus casseliflavus]|uniref:hypothetical protein n=1 Tax=Enterococcus casseliflavus TaxID=37734 RepID=UPI00288DB0BB|nr:hypothetical protein [Enterococcus casseliflavus]MDT2987784.1 hypothetical protein [Enterococcus casseliflavus]